MRGWKVDHTGTGHISGQVSKDRKYLVVKIEWCCDLGLKIYLPTFRHPHSSCVASSSTHLPNLLVIELSRPAIIMQPANELPTLLITGSNGYIGTHIVGLALHRGYRARACVRSTAAMSKLQSAFPNGHQNLSFVVVPDATKAEGYRGAMDGTTAIIHTASPFNFTTEDVEKDLLQPAIQGSLAILEAAQQYGPLVRRVINISSFGAIVDIGQGLRPGYRYTENDWNPMSYEEASASGDGPAAYCASKTLAEQAMWSWMDAKQSEVSFTLSSINPPWTFGPYFADPDLDNLSQSIQALWSLLGAGSVPPTDFAGFVDVRDVAIAALLSATSNTSAGHRFLLGGHFDWQTAVDIIRQRFPEVRNRIPKGRPGSGRAEPVYTLDGGKAKDMLGLEYTALDVTLGDTVSQLLDVEKRRQDVL